MDTRIRYECCPACGAPNPDLKAACAVCDNRLFSDGLEEHQRYVALIAGEHRKQTILWICGWVFVGSFFVGPIMLLFFDRVGRGSVGSGAVTAFLVAWWLVAHGKKRAASAQFLAKHKNA